MNDTLWDVATQFVYQAGHIVRLIYTMFNNTIKVVCMGLRTQYEFMFVCVNSWAEIW